MIIPKEYVEALREYFRIRMQERDFCIGQEEVEVVFRELLGEPEPERYRYYDEGHKSKITADEIINIMKEHFRNIEHIFEQDEALYRKLRK